MKNPYTLEQEAKMDAIAREDPAEHAQKLIALELDLAAANIQIHHLRRTVEDTMHLAKLAESDPVAKLAEATSRLNFRLSEALDQMTGPGSTWSPAKIVAAVANRFDPQRREQNQAVTRAPEPRPKQSRRKTLLESLVPEGATARHQKTPSPLTLNPEGPMAHNHGRHRQEPEKRPARPVYPEPRRARGPAGRKPRRGAAESNRPAKAPRRVR